MTALQPRRGDAETTGQPDRSAGVRDYVSLVKPRIIELLLITTFPVMFLAQRGFPPPGLLIATLVGGALSAASANAFNCIFDRDIDRLMHRTQDRPLVTGVISVRRAVVFASVLCIASVAVLQIFVNTLAALLSLGAVALYVVFYTIILKRRTSQNIVWGGAAGCMPVLIGWAAVTESLAWAPVVLFLVVFFWTPPHYWPLSMRFKDDYAAAGIPMLPVVAEDTAVARRIVMYAWATVITSLALVPAGGMGWIYLVVAVFAGLVFVREAHQLLGRAKDPANSTLASLKPMRLFHYSISYLTILFVAVAIDPLVYLPLSM